MFVWWLSQVLQPQLPGTALAAPQAFLQAPGVRRCFGSSRSLMTAAASAAAVEAAGAAAAHTACQQQRLLFRLLQPVATCAGRK